MSGLQDPLVSGSPTYTHACLAGLMLQEFVTTRGVNQVLDSMYNSVIVLYILIDSVMLIR